MGVIGAIAENVRGGWLGQITLGMIGHVEG